MPKADNRIPDRGDVDPALCWNVRAMFADSGAWERDFASVEQLVRPLEALRGTLDSAEALARYFEAEETLDRLVDRLAVYAHLRADENTAETDGQARLARVRRMTSDIAGRLAWFLPEVLARDEAELLRWAEDEVLRPNRYAVIKLIRRKAHTLSAAEEKLLESMGEILHASARTFSNLVNADLRFPAVRDGEGRERELSEGRFLVFLLDPDRAVRRAAFEAMYDTYAAYRTTLAGTLAQTVRLHNAVAETRHFDSALEASLYRNNIPPAIYDTMIEATHAALPSYYRYTALRRERLGLETLDMYDQYLPLVKDPDLEVPYEQACAWVTESCRPLGEEYLGVLKTAFSDGWIDVCENRGKRSGAYSSGCYDSLPYILLNYQGRLQNVFTLAHELGHSMHSWLARHTQPYRCSQYALFVAEIASTLNEALLLRYLLDTQPDPRFQAVLRNQLCDGFKGTVFRQTMFAEFEKVIHAMDARGEPLTADALCEHYGAMNERYYGPAVKADPRIRMEWARIPHFYFDFYVYQYATSFCASQIFAARILDGDKAARDSYLDLLRAGGSDDPVELIRRAGVDLADRATMESAFARFDASVDALRAALEALPGG